MVDWTGERFIPGFGGTQIRYEHFHRYAVAHELCKGKRTLDYGCGEGYGSAILAKNGSSVVGVDIDPEAINHSKDSYAQFSNIEFQVLENPQLPFPDGHFEFITCFEVIEHVSNQEEIVSELARVLSPNGTLLISTPNKAEYSDANNYSNEFHVKEFYIDEFRTFLTNKFDHVSFLGQRLVASSLIYNLDVDNNLVEITHEITPTSKPPKNLGSVFEPIYVIAACTQGLSPQINGSVFMTSDDALSKEQLDAIPREQINQILEAIEEERKMFRKQLDTNETEIQEERKMVREQLDAYETELEGRRLHIRRLEDKRN